MFSVTTACSCQHLQYQTPRNARCTIPSEMRLPQ
uniref:Uncharacterized protein n=1 Tax=Arundo donax TaxID=35708 RepID=A0A0A8YU96_ARUDO